MALKYRFPAGKIPAENLFKQILFIKNILLLDLGGLSDFQKVN